MQSTLITLHDLADVMASSSYSVFLLEQPAILGTYSKRELEVVVLNDAIEYLKAGKPLLIEDKVSKESRLINSITYKY